MQDKRPDIDGVPLTLPGTFVEQACGRIESHPFLVGFEKGAFDLAFAKRMVAVELGYHLEFVSALGTMRRNFASHPRFILEILDPLLMSEIDGTLRGDVEQSRRPRIEWVYEFASMLGMSQQALMNWGQGAEDFFRKALQGLLAGENLGVAIGALYADEVLAQVWCPKIDQGFRRFSARAQAGARAPINTVRPERLLSYVDGEGFSALEVARGFNVFHTYLGKKFNALATEMEMLKVA